MKNYLPILMAVLFCACHNNEPIYTNNSSVRFKYEISEHYVWFNNTSTGEYKNMDFRWEFGDGNTYDGYDAEHQYLNNGTYKVILKAYQNDILKSSYTNMITINAATPTEWAMGYINGYRFIKIPYENKYYKATCTLRASNGDALYTYSTNATKLSSSNLPYNYIYTEPKEIGLFPYPFYYLCDKVEFKVTYASSASGSYTQLIKVTASSENFVCRKYSNCTVASSDDEKTQVGILIEFKEP